MKKFKRIMALVIALAMVLSMGVMTAFAGDTENAGEGGSDSAATEPGSITINSPIMGAKYKAYQIFDMTMNEQGDSFSYTISKSNPFYNAVVEYAAMPTEEGATDTNADGLTLVASSADSNTFNIHVTDAFDAQKFGKFLEGKLNSTGEDKVTPSTFYEPKYETGKTEVTVATSAAIEFENLPLGYYLITSEYPDPYSYVTLEFGTDPEAEGYQKWTFTKDSTDDEIAAAAQTYAEKTYPTDLAKVEEYVNAHASDFEKSWSEMTQAEKDQVRTDLVNSTKQSAINLIKEKIAGSQSDDNTQPLTSRLVFVDSTTPHADINEKNEVEKWDTPVNPEGHADLPDVPDHGEPEGGKNIVVKEATDSSPAVYADWTEANIGDDVHYQLSINATNFERVEAKDENGNVIMENGHPKFEVKPIQEYVIADYQNKNMTFNAAKKLTVTIVKKQADGTVVNVSEPMDYTKWAQDPYNYFFVNSDKVDLVANGEVFAEGKGGIVIPWVEEITAEQAKTRKNVTITEKLVTDSEEGANEPVYVMATAETPANRRDTDGYLLDENGAKVQETDAENNKLYKKVTYYASKYDNDVTILVDYYMTLNDTADVGGDTADKTEGNKNISQFGVNFLDKDEVTYTPDGPDSPPDQPKQPDEEKEKDDARVYTYALLIHKVDENNRNLAGAEFQIKGLTVTEKTEGWYKVKKYDPDAANFDGADTLKTDKDGNLIVEGLQTKFEVELKETKAPEGYNILEKTEMVKPQKTSEKVETTSTVKHTDENGNVTTVSNTEIIYKDKNGAQIARKVVTPAGTKYYNAQNQEITGDAAETAFNTLIAAFTNYDGDKETDLTLLADLVAKELKIENHKGQELPSTGGIGTTIFYVVGAILVIGAGVILITKRRMDA